MKDNKEKDTLRETLLTGKRSNLWNKENFKKENKAMEKFAKEYIAFLNNSKTERLAVKSIVAILKKAGYKEYSFQDKLKVGDKIYFVNRGKNVFALNIQDNMENGINILGSHLDSPRLDIRPTALFEQNDMVFLNTHLYGGIKPYQWANIPLELTGVIYKDGKKIDVSCGGKDDDYTLTITDLLPHLSKFQAQKTMYEVISPEQLNVLAGSVPFDDKESAVTLNLLKILNEKYGITQKDFHGAELHVVPALESKFVGFDKGLIGGYGQDDKICAYASLRALLDSKNTKTSLCIFADKEEVGSRGNTGMESKSIDVFLENVLASLNHKNTSLTLSTMYQKSHMLSADVDAAIDPSFADVFEVNNSARISHGIDIVKYTGSAAKGGASDANAEFLSKVIDVFNKKDVHYQISEMGKMGIGGGGTIAYMLANKGMEVLDCGVAVLSMHAPFEISSVADLYMMYKGYMAFYEEL